IELVNAFERAGKEDVDAVVEIISANFQRMRAALCGDVVDSFEQIDIATLRRECRNTQACNSGDVDCWSDSVIDRRVEAAVCVLETGLVQCAGIKGGYVTDLHRLICVFQTRTAAHGVQSAHVTRIDGVDVVETVTSAELIARIETMIDPREEIGGIKTSRYHTSTDQLTAIVKSTQAIIDSVDCAWLDRDDGGVVSTRLFEVAEEEGPVAPDRSA